MSAKTPKRPRDGVYHAIWKRSGGSFDAHVREMPQIRQRGADITDTLDALYWKLFAIVGDGLEFLKPVPAYAPRLAVTKPGIRIAAWVSISSARGEFDVLNDKDELWEPPSCAKCKWIRDRRTRTKLRARLTKPGSLATPFQLGMGTICIAPQSFQMTLTQSERNAFTWRPVEMEKSKSVAEPWWELRPKRYHIHRCGIKGVPAGGQRCRSCGRAYWGYGTYSYEMTTDYLAEAELTRIRRSLILEGDAWMWNILIRHSRWMELSRTAVFKGIVPSFYGSVPPSLTTHTPRLIDQDTYRAQFMKAWASARQTTRRTR